MNETQIIEPSHQKATVDGASTDHQVIQQAAENISVANNVSNSVGALQLLGISPAAALLLIIVDMMLFGGTVATLGAAWVVSIPVSLVLGFIVAIFQQRNFGDDWILASAKGAMCGLLTAIPTPLPSVLTAGAGALGGIHKLKSRKNIATQYQQSENVIGTGNSADQSTPSQIEMLPPTAQSSSKQSWIIIALLFAIAIALTVRLFM